MSNEPKSNLNFKTQRACIYAVLTQPLEPGTFGAYLKPGYIFELWFNNLSYMVNLENQDTILKLFDETRRYMRRNKFDSSKFSLFSDFIQAQKTSWKVKGVVCE